MFPVPLEERSIPQRFSKAVRFRPNLLESAFDGKASERLRDKQAAQFAQSDQHVVWSHLSVPDADYNPGSRRHVPEVAHSQHDSKKRSKYNCAPLPDDYLTSRILPAASGGLADIRPEVKRAIENFERQPFLLNVGEDPRNHLAARPRDVEPLQRASSNPLLITDDVSSIKIPIGKRPLQLPRAETTEPPPTFSSDSRFAKYSSEEKRTGKRVLHPVGRDSFDPLHIKATNAGRNIELAPIQGRDHFFTAQQASMAKKLGR